MSNNNDLTQKLRSLAVFEEMKNEPFKARAYEKAALTIENLEGDIKDLYTIGGKDALDELPGIGASISKKIEEFIKTGEIKLYEKMEHQMPIEVKELYSVEGLGPKKIKLLWDKLKIKNLAELETAAIEGKIAKIPHLGLKTQENILRSITFLKEGGNRKVLGWIWNFAQKIEERFKNLERVEHAVVAGSIRRRQETIGDIDLLVVTTKPKLAQETFIKLPQVTAIKVHGPGRSEVRLNNGMDADLRIIPPESFGAALIYFTGDKTHNIELRKRAIEHGFKLNEYGLFKGKKLIAGRTEEEVYEALRLDWIPPEIRTMHGEIEAAENHTLPHLLPYGSVKGDLQVQTNWTDGKASIETMVRVAMELGREYIAITDHTQWLKVAHGLNEEQLKKQGKEIDKLNEKIKEGKFGKQYSKFRILKGAEINILPDGSLDIANNTLKKLDIVAAAVHSHFKMTKMEMTKRIIKALQNPYLNILFHPTGRIINRRPAYEVDMDEIIKTAKKHNVALELDSFPERMDLKDEHVRKAVKMGAKIVIDSDAHASEHLKFIQFGEATARRGWATKNDVLNTLDAEEMVRWFNKKR